MQKIVKKSRKYKAFYTLCSRKSPDGKKQSCQKSIKKEDEQKVIFLKFMFFPDIHLDTCRDIHFYIHFGSHFDIHFNIHFYIHFDILRIFT